MNETIGFDAARQQLAEDMHRRINEIVSHPAIAGDARRITAGIQLAAKAPGMSVLDIISYLEKHVARSGAAHQSLDNRGRSIVLGWNLPSSSHDATSGGEPTLDAAAIYRRRREQMCGRVAETQTEKSTAKPALNAEEIYRRRREQRSRKPTAKREEDE